MIEATGWLVLEATRYRGGKVSDFKVARTTQSVPRLEHNQVSVKLKVIVPESVFDGLMTAQLTVSEDMIIEADVSTEEPTEVTT